MDRPLPCHVYMPAQVKQPLLVLVHGLSTRPERLVQYASRLARRHGVPLLVPDFSQDTFKGFQRLRGQSMPHGAASALIATVRQVVEQYDLASYTFNLKGFSAGAQFAHRFAIHYPQHLRSLTVAAPGWYTYLDRNAPYPYGLENGPLSPSEQDIGRFLSLPVMVCVGANDTERDAQFRMSHSLDHTQGLNRLERACHWHQHLQDEAYKRGLQSRCTLSYLPDTGHSIRQAVKAGGLMQQLFRFISSTALHDTTTVPDAISPASFKTTINRVGTLVDHTA